MASGEIGPGSSTPATTAGASCIALNRLTASFKAPARPLPAIPFGGDGAGEDVVRGYVVRGGVGAVRAYRGLPFAPGPAPGVQAGRRQLLLAYNGLDSAAMVMVWRHWLGRAAPPS